jgi:integron integrase
MAPPSKLLDQLRAVLRRKHYSRRTEDSYVAWILRFIRFHQLRHPRDLGPPAIAAFLTHLAVADRVAASTQNQASCTLLFLYQEVLGVALDALPDVEPAQRPQRLPIVLTRDEVRAVLAQMRGTYSLMAQLLYGSGVRLMECVRLRVKDLDFAQQQLIVRDGKGEKDRVTMLPRHLVTPLQDHLRIVRRTHEEDLARGCGVVYVPYALERKYPNAERERAWQYVFPADRTSTDPRAEIVRRHHLDESGLQKAVRTAVRAAGITKPASCHTFRHSFGRPFGRLVRTSSDVTC